MRFFKKPENRTLLNNILGRKDNWSGHTLGRNWLLNDTVEEQMMGIKGVGRRRRRTQLHDDLRNRKKILGPKGGSCRQ